MTVEESSSEAGGSPLIVFVMVSIPICNKAKVSPPVTVSSITIKEHNAS